MNTVIESNTGGSTMNTITDRITAGIEAELVKAEEQYAAQGLRTVRVTNDVSIYNEGASYYVYVSEGEMKTMNAESGDRHPMAKVADGEVVRYKWDGMQIAMTRIGIFDTIARINLPGDRGNRITFMAERAPAAA